MILKQVIECISQESVRISHSWEYYPNHFTDEAKCFFVDEIPDWLLNMKVSTMYAYSEDLINISVSKSDKLIFGSEYCYCYKSIVNFLESIDKYLD